ncbi:LysR family transcriptional regulator [Leifsonia aquatica]|uniref:LysR family transcriptional regulator n=1 Tax=Leifsonia aquatica TaxID=144185 RepID=UPI00382F387C
MELRQLQIFETIVHERTVGAAAVALDRAPSSVSEQLRSLERSLGVTLFDRTGRGMRLTSAGERLRPWARLLLEQAKEARRDVTSGPVEVHIAALETVMAIHVPRVLQRLASRHPEIRARTSSRISRSDLLSDVADGVADAGLLLDLGDELGDLGFAVPDSDLALLDVEPVPLSVVVAPSHPLASTATLDPSAIASYPFIGNTHACSFWLAADTLTGPKTERIEAGSVTIAKAWVAQGLGVAVLPDFAIAPELTAGSLVRLPAAAPQLCLRLVWRPDREIQLGVRELLYAVADATAENAATQPTESR